MGYKLSPSALKFYFNCPRCFYLGTKEHIYRPRIFEASIANGMDTIVKEWFDTFRAENKAPDEIEKQGLELFKDANLIKKWREQGIYWYDKKGNTFMGKIDDLLVSPSGSLVVFDYKTKGTPIKGDPLKDRPEYKLQLESYAFIFQQMKHAVADHGYLFYFIPSKIKEPGLVEFENVLWRVPLDLSRPEKAFKEALEVLEQNYEPKPSKNCEFCRREEILSKRNN